MIILYKTLIRPKLEYNSVVRNNLSLTKSNSNEIVRRKFIAMLYDTFFEKKLFCNYFRLCERIYLNSLHVGRMSFDCKLIVD